MSVSFATRVGGIPCRCEVTHYSPEGTATLETPADPEMFEFELLDQRGRRAEWLDKFVDPDLEMDLLQQFIEAKAHLFFTEPDYGE